jgi:hypothetical protein
MDKRKAAKFVAKALVMWAADNFIEKSLVKAIPSTQKLHANELAGAVGSYFVAEALEPHTDKLVDDLFDKYETKTN